MTHDEKNRAPLDTTPVRPLTPTLSPSDGERENCRDRGGDLRLSLSPSDGERAGVRGLIVSRCAPKNPNAQIRMEFRLDCSNVIRIWSLGFLSSFAIRHSDFA